MNKVIKKYFSSGNWYYEEIDNFYNLYNFISFWYKFSKLDGMLDGDKIHHFIEDFIEKNNIVEDLSKEDFEKILIKLCKKLKKIKPGDFEH